MSPRTAFNLACELQLQRLRHQFASVSLGSSMPPHRSAVQAVETRTRFDRFNGQAGKAAQRRMERLAKHGQLRLGWQ